MTLELFIMVLCSFYWLTYGIAAWRGCSKTIMIKIVIVQQSISKIILQKPRFYPYDVT